MFHFLNWDTLINRTSRFWEGVDKWVAHKLLPFNYTSSEAGLEGGDDSISGTVISKAWALSVLVKAVERVSENRESCGERGEGEREEEIKGEEREGEGERMEGERMEGEKMEERVTEKSCGQIKSRGLEGASGDGGGCDGRGVGDEGGEVEKRVEGEGTEEEAGVEEGEKGEGEKDDVLEEGLEDNLCQLWDASMISVSVVYTQCMCVGL